MNDAVSPNSVVHPQPASPADGYVPVIDPSRTTRMTPWGLVVVLVASTAAFVANLVGGLGFPANAPAEWMLNAGLGLMLFATMVVSGVGFAVALRKGLVRPSRVFPWLGLALALVGVASWVLTSGGLWQTLFEGGRGNYVADVGGAFFASPLWAMAPMFAALGLRRGGHPAPTVAGWLAIVLWAVVAAGVATSALLYAAGLTD